VFVPRPTFQIVVLSGFLVSALFAGAEARAGYLPVSGKKALPECLIDTDSELGFGGSACSSGGRKADKEMVERELQRELLELHSLAADLSTSGAGGATSSTSLVGNGVGGTPPAMATEAEISGPTIARWLVIEQTSLQTTRYVSSLMRPPRKKPE
jgi:hypothetical protein